jgi:hypothetical protein
MSEVLILLITGIKKRGLYVLDSYQIQQNSRTVFGDIDD